MKIKEYRLRLGLTQVQFSELFGIPLDNIKSWDSGRCYPPKWVEKLLLDKMEQINREGLKK